MIELDKDELRTAKFLGWAILYALFLAGCALGLWLGTGRAKADPRPVPLHGRAPSGYHGSGGWAVPNNRDAEQAIERHFGRCPDGYYGDGNYCVQNRR